MGVTEAGGGGEQAAVEMITALFGAPPSGELWIGDDAAVVSLPGPSVLVATDSVVEGVHVDLDLAGLDDMGWKALAVNLSDIAAMGGHPHRAVVAVSAPPSLDLGLLYAGIAACAEEYRCPVVGGDLSEASQVVVAATVLGSTGGETAVTRTGARPGDTVFVTGRLGAAAAGLEVLRGAARSGMAQRAEAAALAAAHLRPRPRIDEGLAARKAGATAMIDISDGFGRDIDRLATGSGVGLLLDHVPVAAGATRREALGGGEDYELIFTSSQPMEVDRAFATAGLAAPVRIGVCTADPDQRELAGSRLRPVGWDHLGPRGGY